MECEGMGKIADWIHERGHTVNCTRLHRNDPLPLENEFDLLLIMGGPMNIYEYRNYPWLPAEKETIKRAIDSGKKVLGICLGAQLIADVLGAKIYQNAQMEIGWYPVHFKSVKKSIPAFAAFPESLTVLHWHGDTFDLPEGAVNLAESAACRNQAFIYGDRVIGLQFHIEMDEPDVNAFLDDILPEPIPGQIQSAQQISEGNHHLPSIHSALYSMLDAWTVSLPAC